MNLCISQATTHAGPVRGRCVRVRRRRLDRGRTLADQARKAPGKQLDRRHPTATGRPEDSTGGRRVPGRPPAVARRTAKSHFDHFRRRLELCQALGIPTLLVVADFAGRPDPTALQRAVVSLTQAAQWAAAFEVRLALEFRGSDAFCTCLDTAIGLVSQCGEPNVGVCLDLFHYYKGPSKPEDLAGSDPRESRLRSAL